MNFTRILLSIVFFLFASTALATKHEKKQKHEKTLVCHVTGSGKINLLSVSKAAKHVGNPSHSYGDVADYFPETIGATGVGKDDSDGDGVDDGCAAESVCPCWIDADLPVLSDVIDCEVSYDVAGSGALFATIEWLPTPPDVDNDYAGALLLSPNSHSGGPSHEDACGFDRDAYMQLVGDSSAPTHAAFERCFIDLAAICESVAFCGDAILDPGEQCDDGNTNNGDGCNDICEIE